ncbi:MAG TPA: hypothetical protein VGL51_04385 [Solirubrobacteraceae bacterium]
MEHQLVAVEPPPQLADQGQAAEVGLVRCRVVVGVRGVVALGLVHRHVGALDQQLGSVSVFGEHRHPDRALHGQRQRLDVDRTLQRGPDPLYQRRHVLWLGQVAEQQGELVAAQAGDRVRGPDGTTKPDSDLGQQLVAGGVAEGVVDLLEAVEVHQHHGQPGQVALGLCDGVLDALLEQDPVGKPGQRVVQRLVLVELGLADQLVLGALSLADVLDHHHRRGRLLVGGALPDGSQQRPHQVSVSPLAARLQLKGLAPSAHQVVEPRLRLPAVCRRDAVGERELLKLGGGRAEHLLERRVGLEHPTLAVDSEDPDRRAVEQGPKPPERARLPAPGLELGRSADGRREHHREHLQGLAVVLVEPVLPGATHHVQRADHLGSLKQRHADQRLVADHRPQVLVDARVVGGVLHQQRLAAVDGVASHRGRDRALGVLDHAGDSGHRAGVEHVALDQVDHRAVGAGDRLRAVGDQRHHRFQAVVGGGDLALGLDDQRKTLLTAQLGAWQPVPRAVSRAPAQGGLVG